MSDEKGNQMKFSADESFESFDVLGFSLLQNSIMFSLSFLQLYIYFLFNSDVS